MSEHVLGRLVELAARNPEMAVTSAEINRDTITSMGQEITRLIGELKKRDDKIEDLTRQVGTVREWIEAKEEAVEEFEVQRLHVLLEDIADNALVFVDKSDGKPRRVYNLIGDGQRLKRVALELHRYMRGRRTELRRVCPVCRTVDCEGCTSDGRWPEVDAIEKAMRVGGGK